MTMSYETPGAFFAFIMIVAIVSSVAGAGFAGADAAGAAGLSAAFLSPPQPPSRPVARDSASSPAISICRWVFIKKSTPCFISHWLYSPIMGFFLRQTLRLAERYCGVQ